MPFKITWYILDTSALDNPQLGADNDNLQLAAMKINIPSFDH